MLVLIIVSIEHDHENYILEFCYKLDELKVIHPLFAHSIVYIDKVCFQRVIVV